MDLPYKAEYAKSGRASCRGCKSGIGKDTLRLAVMVQSPMFDGKVPNWYHSMCFFSKQRPKSVDDIGHFESLRWEDQENIRNKIANAQAMAVPAQKGKKRNAAGAGSSKDALKEFSIQYSKSSRANCHGCKQKIMKDEIRAAKKDYESDNAKRYGGIDMWHHLTCFAKLRSELGYFECGDKLTGFKTLSKDDQNEVKKQLPAIKQEDVPVKKTKVEDEVDGKNAIEKKLKEQNKTIFSYRDKLKNLQKADLKFLLEENNQQIPPGVDRMLDRLADLLAFGALKPCPECKSGQLVLDKMGYACRGNLSEWSKCTFVTKEPERQLVVIPAELAEDYAFLGKYDSRKLPKPRVIKDAKPTTSTSLIKKEESEESDRPKVDRERPALYNMEFVIVGNVKDKDALKKQIATNGGKVVTKIKNTVMAVISTENEVEKMGSRITQAQDEDVHVVSEDFIDEVKEYSGRIPELVTKKSICDWGSDPNVRLPPEPTSSSMKPKSMFSKVPSKLKMKFSRGGAVDPDSELDDCAHIYQKDGDKYSVVLGLTDIQRQKNSYYKLQLLEADGRNKFWLFRSWGRIGTTIGNHKLEELPLYEAIEQFCGLYEEKSGNAWRDRHNFVKVPNRMYPIDIDYGDDLEEKLNAEDSVESKLPPSVQDLIKLIFNVQRMRNVMLEFELDTEKMPLGKLSKSQLQNAYKVLSELQELIESKASLNRLVDATNRFYTFVPHSFGIDNPPLIDNLEIIKKKIEMVENLMELEIAYNLMKSSDTDKNKLDAHYEKLNTEIDVLSRETEEFKIIQEYVKNTHAATHASYTLEIDDVYVIKRRGEEKRYKPFRKLHNKKLLWHGSRTTNFAGILSQGLRIAPPEAPVTGYMFGKGIYFADMVSKSANYCAADPTNKTGLLLLCEVALGEMHELKQAKYIEKLPKGKHSVKGVGRTEPDPEVVKMLDDVHVPIGEGKSAKSSKETALLYNEYIVYDVAQVNIKYLLKMKFNYKY